MMSKKCVDLPLAPFSHQGPQLLGQLDYQLAGMENPFPVGFSAVARPGGSIATLDATVGDQALQMLQNIQIG